MNTITENQVTYNEFIQQNSLELFKKTVISFKEKAKKDGLDASEHILYNLIRGLKANRGFTNEKQEYTDGFYTAQSSLKYKLKYNTSKDTLLSTFSSDTIASFMKSLES